METIFIVCGLAGVQLIPIFALTYLQYEIPTIERYFSINVPANLSSMAAMFLTFSLVFLNIQSVLLPINVAISILLMIALSVGINYTYKAYTIEEGYYATIPYFIVYSCLLFALTTIEYPFVTIRSHPYSFMLTCSLICYILFSIIALVSSGFHTSLLNYIAFLGLLVASINVIFTVGSQVSHKPIIFIANFLLLQLIHIYIYLAHLLSVKFEILSHVQSGLRYDTKPAIDEEKQDNSPTR